MGAAVTALISEAIPMLAAVGSSSGVRRGSEPISLSLSPEISSSSLPSSGVKGFMSGAGTDGGGWACARRVAIGPATGRKSSEVGVIFPVGGIAVRTVRWVGTLVEGCFPGRAGGVGGQAPSAWVLARARSDVLVLRGPGDVDGLDGCMMNGGEVVCCGTTERRREKQANKNWPVISEPKVMGGRMRLRRVAENIR